MKVRELQEHLSKLDPEIDVVCYSEDERLLVEKRGFVLRNIMGSALDIGHFITLRSLH
jgi:hypothetical protein